MSLDQAIHAMLAEESARLDGAVSPDELAVIVERAFEISRQKQKALQAEGYERARQRDVSFGRPKKPKPKNWPDVHQACTEGLISKEQACAELGISRGTLAKWLRGE